jgi:biotin carboxyl carrier protein
MAFGAEFRCDHCGISSVLIVDRALVPLNTLLKQGEKVCSTCGRMALREARFCQEGHVLIRRCVYHNCHREFPSDHQRCDFCGRLQDGKESPPRCEFCGGFQEAKERIVESPIFGTFYRAPGLGAPPFVEVGAHVKKGQVLCIIEAELMMNEIECPYDGEIVAINVDNAQLVQYGEGLFAMSVKPGLPF